MFFKVFTCVHDRRCKYTGPAVALNSFACSMKESIIEYKEKVISNQGRRVKCYEYINAIAAATNEVSCLF